MIRPRIRLKTPQEIDGMRPANRLVAQILAEVERMIRPGVSTGAIDRHIEAYFDRHDAVPLFKNYPGKTPFPAVTCISVNEEVVHGIPSDRILKDGDLVTVDTGCNYRGWCGDSAITVPVGEVAPERRKLHQVAEETLQIAIRETGRQRKWSQVARKMAEHVRAHGYSVVEQFVGHGIGRTMHEDPQVPNYDSRSWNKQDFWLDQGLVIAIEPMVNMGKKDVKVLEDNWTVITKDRQPSVHVEHVVAITARGVEVLTDRSEFQQ
ncbi:MAG TPA: type I methionyl aminopeptidase [Planctomycetia bacterium]|nr:type I methionyl aminopeptidase [Planctomycetia bacterium]